MATSSELETAAAAPKKTMIDGESVEEHSLRERAEMDDYISQKKAGTRKTLPVRFAKINPGGTT